MPADPERTYAEKGWKSYGDWLGTGTIAPRLRSYRDFNEARSFVWSLKLKSSTEWRDFCKGRMPLKGKLPLDIPVAANVIYAEKGWKSMGDWLGTGRVADQLKQYRPFLEARSFARSLNLKNRDEWRVFCNGELPSKGELPPDIPSNPNLTYASQGWQGYADWLLPTQPEV